MDTLEKQAALYDIVQYILETEEEDYYDNYIPDNYDNLTDLLQNWQNDDHIYVKALLVRGETLETQSIIF